MGRHWKVGDLAKLTGLTIRTLRFYDQIGLFSPSGHSDSGHRLYSEADISRLQQIVSLKELGLSLDEVKSVMAGSTYSPKQIVSLQMTRLQESIKAQQQLLKQLEHVSGLMNGNQPLTVEHFTKLLEMMKHNQPKQAIERRMSWESNLDRLGDFLADNSDNPKGE